jgi:UTP--glucose-1-phosphate uridylyltransferase
MNNKGSDTLTPIIRKAIVPAAGLGTRHFPASHAVKKELFPVVGPDGIARALIHYHLIDLVGAGIEEICIIVQPGADAAIRDYLAGPDAAYLRRLEKYPKLHEEACAMRTLLPRLTFAVQREQEGFGHAVFQTGAFAAGERVLLCLGDHLFRGSSVSPCTEMIAIAQTTGNRSISAVNRIGPADLKGFGTIAGARTAGNSRLIEVSRIIEKPDLATARQSLRVDGLESDEFLGWFGIHILAPSIYDILERMIRDDIRDNGEFQLTRAQEFQRQAEGYLALEMTGAQRFDFGVPDDFVASLGAFRKGTA